jgi:hypothetical protein
VKRLLLLTPLLALAWGAAPPQGPATFDYAHAPQPHTIQRTAAERQAARDAANTGDAERWGVTLALLLELAVNAGDPIDRAAVLDAALDELTAPPARALIGQLSPQRRQSLHAALARFDRDDPAGIGPFTRQLAAQRLDTITTDVLEANDPNAALDALLAQHGWHAAGQHGPRGRQRARDRADYRAVDRHEVFRIEGMARRHMLLPPTEALAAVPREELDRKWQRARNLSAHIDRLWTHQDGPRVHDFILDLALKDNTGIVRLVHADTQGLAQEDRMRRWRLREALWRLGDG